jgi:RNA polymerase sigma-70 factor (ECF subfamily)
MHDIQPNLADLATHWSRVLQAQDPQGDSAASARNELLVRYHEAILRYLRAELRDEHAAGQLFSDFAVRVLEVDSFLKRADPDRGRFRDYLKAVLRRMVIDHYRGKGRDQKKRAELPADGGHDPAVEPSPEPDADAQFTECWRQELINQAWKALEETEKRTGQPYCSALRLKDAHPGLRSAQLAEQLTALLGRPVTAAGLRQTLHRGRDLFGELLVQEVARSLRTTPGEEVTAARLEQELIDLSLLLSYCKAALERYRAGA